MAPRDRSAYTRVVGLPSVSLLMTEHSISGKIPSLSTMRPRALHDLVRVGRSFDGGYVLPERILRATDLLIGLGIETDWSFERAFLNASDARLIALDGTVSLAVFSSRLFADIARVLYNAIRFRRGAALDAMLHVRFHVNLCADFAWFFFRPRRTFLSKMLMGTRGVNALTWAELRSMWSSESPVPRVFVKMDIEGAEYSVLPQLMESSDSVIGLVLEVHDLDKQWQAFDSIRMQLASRFSVVHIHGNNNAPLISGTTVPTVLELTFINRDYLTADELATPTSAVYPREGLDSPCLRGQPDYELSFV